MRNKLIKVALAQVEWAALLPDKWAEQMAAPFEWADAFVVVAAAIFFKIAIRIWNLPMALTESTEITTYVLTDDSCVDAPESLELLNTTNYHFDLVKHGPPPASPFGKEDYKRLADGDSA
jgi:hypothetical protein